MDVSAVTFPFQIKKKKKKRSTVVFLKWLIINGLQYSLQCFQRFPYLVQPGRHMKTAFPFSAFQRQQYFAPAVKVTKPLAVFRVGKMRPGIIVHFFKPGEALFISGE